jgi:hypothetical protein
VNRLFASGHEMDMFSMGFWIGGRAQEIELKIEMERV